MSKIAFEKIPNNTRHVNVFQKVLYEMKDIEGLYEVFDKSKGRKKEETWQNHVSIISRLKINDTFSDFDQQIVDKAIKLFPDNRIIAGAFKVHKIGPEKVSLANYTSEKAEAKFKENKYDEALSLFQKAKEYNPLESSHYINSAQIYTILGQTKKSIDELQHIKNLDIQKNDGKWEFLMAMNKLKENQNGKACELLKKAFWKGYNKESTSRLFRSLGCN